MTRACRENTATLKNGLKSHYYEWPGDGPALILLHPSAGYARIWEWVAEALGNRFHIFAPDQRGHGLSGRPDGDYSAQEYAHDLELFMQELGIDRAIVVGHSLGGRVAQVFAAMYPERILALGLVNGPHVCNFRVTRADAKLVLRVAQMTTEYPEDFASEDEIRAFYKGHRPWNHEADELLNHRIAHNFRRLETGRIIPLHDDVRVAQGLSHMLDDLSSYARGTECPVLLMRASRSTASREEIEELSRYWKDARVIDLDGDYALQLDNPQGVAQTITEFAQNLELI
ncbi:alpha/beta hydrolase [Sphingobium sp.]|uniref:alpha/beta fold hydrolase n=1 Tax=Sphingobium sp. TaxID=1912891 RepID=UPI0028BDD639|nr:alpha/beta hydrolase [Sphingobium sp.]